MVPQRLVALFTQTTGPFLDDRAVYLLHARGRRARAWREREDMQLRQPARIDQVERASKHILVFGRKARDDIRAKNHVGAQTSHLLAKRNCIVARVASLNALENEIIACLQ